MDQLLWYLLAGTRGGWNRLRIVETLEQRPYNAHQLSELLGLDYRTTRHHLAVLSRNYVVTSPAPGSYGAMYFLGGMVKDHARTIREIRRALRSTPPGLSAERIKWRRPRPTD